MQRAASATLASVARLKAFTWEPDLLGWKELEKVWSSCGCVSTAPTRCFLRQAPAQCLPPLSPCVCLHAGNSDDSSDGTSSDDEMDVAEEMYVCPPALCVQVASCTPQAVEPAAGSLELAAQEAQDPQLCRSVDCLLCDSLEALLF